MSRTIFLKAKWQQLMMLNYVVKRQLLEPLVPSGCEIDLFKGNAVLSVVGFQFNDLSSFGLPVIGCRSFPQLNLRFYVKRCLSGNRVRKGVVFIKEICPKILVSIAARLSYGENYLTLPMDYKVSEKEVSYSFCLAGKWSELAVKHSGDFCLPDKNSLNDFIVSRYWGYTSQADRSTKEFEVKHAPWRVSVATDLYCHADFSSIYGRQTAEVLEQAPTSVFVANGSAISLHLPTTLSTSADPRRVQLSAGAI